MTYGWDWAQEHADLTVLLPGDVPLHFQRLPKDGDGNDIESAEFCMGSRGYSEREEPRHRVLITEPFYMGVFPLTQSQWRALAGLSDTELKSDPSHFKGDLHPVEQVSWNDVDQWCRLLTGSGLLDDAGVVDLLKWDNVTAVLPGEAQWEYACRAGSETDYYTGDGEAALLEAGWFSGNSVDSTHPVGDKRPNSFGLYDMHGNVHEWCSDAWDEHAYKRRTDGAGDPPTVEGDSGSFRVVRGGCWNYSAWDYRSAYRYWRYPVGYWNQGFRVCLVSGSCPASSPDETSADRGSGGEARRDDAAGPQRTSEALENIFPDNMRLPPPPKSSE